MKKQTLLLLISASTALAQTTMFTSDFDANTGAVVLAGDTDNTSGAASLDVTWIKHASVSAVSNLSAISTGDSGTAGGFARLQNGGAPYANANNVFISRNHNLDSNKSTSKRGFSFTFTTTSSWDLNKLTVLSGHTNNTGISDQSNSSNLNFVISGGTLASPISSSATENYGSSPAYHTVNFNLTGHTLGAGTYTVQVFQSHLVGGGAYAIYDGISMEGHSDAPPAPTVTSFSVDKSYATSGSSATFSWITEGATSLTLNPGNIDLLPFSTDGEGSTAVTINSGGTYTLSATNENGTTTREVDIFVGPARPNIVFFLVDDMGPQDTSIPFNVDGNGDPVSYNFNTFYQTPNMETLAANGMRFVTAYAQSVCSPTRTGLMTGRNSARHAVTDWVGGGGSGSPTNWRSSGLDATDVTLPQILRSSGYRTIHVGKAHFGSNFIGKDPLNLGFDINIGGANFGHPGSYTGTYGSGGSRAVPHLEAYHNTGTFLTKALATEANKAIEAASNEGRPFFLNMAFYAVHAPFTTNPDATGDYSASTNANHAKYATMLEGMDLAVGQIRQKLIDLGIAKDTLIIFLGDNGSDSPALPVDGLPNGIYSDFPMRGKKGSKWEGGSRVPFIACWATPDASNPFQQITNIPANSIETDIVASWDVPVTILAAAGLPKPANFGEDGHDLLPYLRAIPGSHRPQEMVIHYPHNHRSDFFSFIREGDMKLIYNFQSDSHQLYNLATDPTESINLANTDPNTTTRLTRLLAQRLNAMWGTAGPLRPTTGTTAPSGNVISIPNNETTDVDSDGLADTLEDTNRNGLVDTSETDPDDEDSDDDQTSDGDEATLGLDPLDQNSYFYLNPETLVSGNLKITWPSAAGNTFTIRSSTDMIDWTTIVASGVSAAVSGNSTRYDLGTPTGVMKFYRVELE
ncbi:hypothetical protein NT6N_16650 [Oceaniferula spumae]|uniref:Sulfatase N-terminal domain-containing protein n=1 Tax=Oceaniferula spumae TaxID=2979115 RepID=A0AAT9FKT7_9BACT